MKLEYIIKDNDTTIKHILKEKFYMSDRLILKLKRNEKIELNDVVVNINHPLTIGDKLTVFLDFEEDNSNIISNQMDLDILYEDEYLLIVNKSAGMPVHPSMKYYTNSLSNGVRYYFDKINLNKKIRPVNRLDKDTSRYSYFCKE